MDLSNLGTLNQAAPLDLSQYESSKGGFEMPKAGEYVVRAPETFSAASFGKTQNNDLKVSIDPTIVGPTNEGTTIRYCQVSAKTFERNGKQVSYVGDYLKAVGETGEVPTDPQAIADVVERTAGRTFRVYVDWEASHRASGFRLKGMRNFPKDPKTGEPQSWTEHPTEKDQDGQPLRLRANLIVSRYIDAAA